MATLSTIETNVRRNLSSPGSTGYLSTDLRHFIGEGYRKVSMKMIEKGQGYFEVTTNLGFTANVESVDISALSPSFYLIARLERRVTYGTIPMKEVQRRFTSNLSLGTGAGDAYVPDYRLQSLNIILEPTPQFTEAGSATTGLKLDYVYIPTFPTASSIDSFTFDSNFPTFWEPLVELYATIAALESKDGAGGISDVNSFRARLAEWEDRLEDSLDRYEYPDQVQYMGVDYNAPLFGYY